MIQLAILTNSPGEVISGKAALETFFDTKNNSSNEGAVTYYKIKNATKDVTFAKATYFPGENEYGALFLIQTNLDGSSFLSFSGTIEDSDVLCLN